MVRKRALTYLGVAEEWPTLSPAEQARRLRQLPHDSGHEFFLDLLVDVTGLVSYFTMASVILRGTLL